MKINRKPLKANNRNKKNMALIILGLTVIFGCSKFIEVEAPITSVNQGNVYSDNGNASSVLTGIYASIASSNFSLNISVYNELLADNLVLYDESNLLPKQFYQNAMNSKYQTGGSSIWNDEYAYIYYANAAIEGLNLSSTLSPIVKQHLLGEAYFIRSFIYYYLTNMFGDVPLLLETNYKTNSNIGNTAKEKILEQLVEDLKLSKELLDSNYLGGDVIKYTTERIRPNKMAASALLARVYLSQKKYNLAEMESNTVINNKILYSLSEVSSVFLKNSSETIWALQPVQNGKNTSEGEFYNLSIVGLNYNNYTYLSSDLYNSFEVGDLRKENWVGIYEMDNIKYPYPLKYKVQSGDPSSATEYTIVFRLAEQYLIRAEARARQNNLIGSINDLNEIRKRSRAQSSNDIPNPLPNLNYNLSLDQTLAAILHEKRIELFTEWGNRWFDLKNFEVIDKVMGDATPKKGGEWKSFKQLYPIPLLELQRNPNLKQNSGYN